MKFKKIFSILLLVVICFLSVSCSTSKQDYDIAIFTRDKVVTFRNNGNELEKISSSRRKDGDQNFIETIISDSNLYTATVPMAPGRSTYLINIDINTLDVKKTKLDLIGKIGLSNNHFYATQMFNDKTTFFRYDKDNLEKLSENSIQDENMNYTTGIREHGDYVYALIGAVNKETLKPKNVLWKMDKSFNIIEKIDLNYILGGYIDLEIIGDKFYIVEGTKGKRADGEPGGGQNIVTYDLNTGKIENIALKYNYPKKIYYDKKNNNLIIQHYGVYIKDFRFTIYSLDTQQEKYITFPEYENKASDINSFYFKDDNYYFLLSEINKVVKYNVVTDEKKEYSLEKFKLDTPHTIVAR